MLITGLCTAINSIQNPNGFEACILITGSNLYLRFVGNTDTRRPPPHHYYSPHSRPHTVVLHTILRTSAAASPWCRCAKEICRRASNRLRKKRKTDNTQGGLLAHHFSNLNTISGWCELLTIVNIHIACFFGFRYSCRGRYLMFVLGP